jgi:hypothetical protein
MAATPTKKTTAKKTTARKTGARQTAAKKTLTTKAATAPAEQTSVRSVNDRLDGVSDRLEDAFESAVHFARDAAHTYIGIGLVVQDRITNRGTAATSRSGNLLTEAKDKGHDRVTEIQHWIEPYAKRVTERFEPITERIESTLPAPVKEALDSGRERVRELLAV